MDNTFGSLQLTGTINQPPKMTPGEISKTALIVRGGIIFETPPLSFKTSKNFVQKPFL
jgi:hypothetical protein